MTWPSLLLRESWLLFQRIGGTQFRCIVICQRSGYSSITAILRSLGMAIEFQKDINFSVPPAIYRHRVLHLHRAIPWSSAYKSVSQKNGNNHGQ